MASVPLNAGKRSYNQSVIIACAECGAKFHPKCSRETSARFCSRQCSAASVAHTEESAKAKLLTNIIVTDDGCHLWRGPHNNYGYGQICVGRKIWRTHRLAAALLNGEDVTGKTVRHTCDKPPCVNPAHLVIGTVADNAKDMLNRDRQRGGKNAPKIGTGAARGDYWRSIIHGLIQG